MHVRKGALVLTLVAVGLCAPSPASAAPVAITLCALPGAATMAGGASVPIWGFATGCANPGLPGPVLSVTVGDTVAITVTNALPAGHPLTLEAPRLAFDPGPHPAPPGGTVPRTFTASAPGTYLYQSGGDAGRQAAMGLYGALIVRPATPNQAYHAASSAYDVEAVLVLSAVDPAFNHAPDTFDLHGY